MKNSWEYHRPSNKRHKYDKKPKQPKKEKQQEEKVPTFDEALHQELSWIKSVKVIPSGMLCADKYVISFTCSIRRFDPKIKEFEDFVRLFFKVKKLQHTVIFCWQHTGLTLIVFKSEFKWLK